MNIVCMFQLSYFGVTLLYFNKIKTAVDDDGAYPGVQCSLRRIVPVNIPVYFIESCIQSLQSFHFIFCIAKTKTHHRPIVAPVQLLLGLAVTGFTAADDPIYVLLFANQIIFSVYIPGTYERSGKYCVNYLLIVFLS
jgi:hypothetical protein